MSLLRRWTVGVLIFVALGSSAFAQQRKPDLRTSPEPNPLEMMGVDLKGRDYQFYSKSHALVIGQRNYANRLKLDEVTEEVKNLKSALEIHGFDVSVYWDLDSSELGPVIDSFVRTYGYDPEARLLFYFSGHGATRTVNNSPVGYVLPVDIPAGNSGSAFLTRALPLSQFVEWATRMEVKHALFLFDSCFSGSIFRTKGGGDSNPAPQPQAYVFSDAANLPMREFITAGSSSQEVPAKSVFVDLLIRVLLGQKREADVNGDGYVTGAELGTYLKSWVPAFNRQQTPGVGRPFVPEFSTGDYIFRVLSDKSVAKTAPAEQPDGGPTFTPIFVGAPDDGGRVVAQAYAVERISTLDPACQADCSEDKAKEIAIELSIPKGLPANAIFDEAELSCTGGSCSGRFKVLQPPTIATDRRSVRARVSSWGTLSVWKLRSKVLVPALVDTTAAVVLNSQKNILTSVAVDAIAVVNNRESSTSAELQQIIQNLQSDDANTRRSARVYLGKVLSSQDKPEVTADLIRRIPTSNYRYQLGVVEALAKAPSGWFSSETVSKDILEKVRDNPKTESSLKQTAKLALQNMGAYAFYEIGDDSWLTKNGQLLPVGISVKPLPPIASIATGAKLKAASSVYLRINPSVDSPVLSLLDGGKCVKVIRRDRQISERTGWLRVTAPLDCAS